MIKMLLAFIFRAIALTFMIRVRYRDVLILDIDNTLAHTWESISDAKDLSTRERLKSLKVKKRILKYVRTKYPRHNILYLTARSYRYYFLTKHWLRDVGMNVKYTNLILVKNANKKLWYIETLNKYSSVVFMDDLSYNHEHGEVLYYDNVKEAVKNMDIIYYDFQKITKISEQEL